MGLTPGVLARALREAAKCEKSACSMLIDITCEGLKSHPRGDDLRARPHRGSRAAGGNRPMQGLLAREPHTRGDVTGPGVTGRHGWGRGGAAKRGAGPLGTSASQPPERCGLFSRGPGLRRPSPQN